MRILFDVGANNGSRWYEDLSRDQTNTFVYMFEPTPELCDIIKAKYQHLKNWLLIETAVSNYEGIATFNIAGHYDWGCSSLFNFKEDIKDTWPKERVAPSGDLHFTKQIEVNVTTLKTFIKNHPEITAIDYLHVDTQGSDLNVLKGLGEYISIVRIGNIEAALEAPLYDESPTKDECVKWIESNGFRVESISGGPHECDINFVAI
jgi:FkbM family methyltransferase